MARPLRLLLTGDVMLGRGIDQVMAHPVSPELFEPVVRDARRYVALAEAVNGPIPAPVPPTWPWGEALVVMEQLAPDLRVINLETAVTARGSPWRGKVIHYRMHPAHLASLQVARIDACVLANNHVLDWGVEGLIDTLSALESAGIAVAGAGLDRSAAERPLALQRPDGGRLLLSAWAVPSSGVPGAWAAREGRPGVALLEDLDGAALERIAGALAPHRRPGDRVLVSLHWGANWVPEVPAEQRRFAWALIDQDITDGVHGHSSHHPLPIEVHRGKVVLHGCGDLINDYEGIGDGHGGLPLDLGCLYLLELDSAGGDRQRLEVVPFRRRCLQLCTAGMADREELDRLLGPLPAGVRIRL